MNLVQKMLSLTSLVLFVGCNAPPAETKLAEGRAALAGAEAISSADDCATIHAWVEANRAKLPVDYEAFTRYPIAYRRAIFDALPAEAKGELWRQHFRAYASTHPLSDRQAAAIARLSEQASGAFAGGTGGRGDARLRAEDREPFSPEEMANLVAHLGPEDASDAQTPASGDAVNGACECSKTDDWCTWGMTCKNSNCAPTNSGCGTFWRQKCDGLCDW